MSHAWYGLLEYAVLPSTPLAPAAVAAKVALDQLVQTPFGMALFFAVMKLLEGKPRQVQQELQGKVSLSHSSLQSQTLPPCHLSKHLSPETCSCCIENTLVSWTVLLLLLYAS
jgi:hypothetical protein